MENLRMGPAGQMASQRLEQAQMLAVLMQMVGELIAPATLGEGTEAPAITPEAVGQDIAKIQACAQMVGMTPGDFVASVQYAIWVRRLRAEEIKVENVVNIQGRAPEQAGEWRGYITSVPKEKAKIH